MRPPRKRQQSEAERRNLLVRRGELAALALHPSWQVLRARIEEERVEIERHVTSEALKLNGGMSLERQAFLRGCVQGLDFALSIPEDANRKLELTRREEAA
ncbi:MAG TPA: hypothetical protein VKD72_36500 [Gemmataceae bacterium]|nr:hypothetical protein [Gemmataceae bacterium]